MERNKDGHSQGLVSIIIPNFNSRQYIQRTIQSIYSQSYEYFEIIIVDDCSSDDSVDFIRNLDFIDNRLNLLVLDKNSGRPAIPRNFGLQQAKGEFIAFMDSDDVWHSDKLKIQLAVMYRYNAGFSCTNLVNFSNDDELLDQPKCSCNSDVKYLSFKKLLQKNVVPNSSVIVRREYLSGLKFNEDERYKAIEDYHLWLQLVQKGVTAIKLNSPLLFYRISDTSISRNKLQMFKKNFMLLSEMRDCGKSLGAMVYVYMISYVFYSILRVLRQKM